MSQLMKNLFSLLDDVPPSKEERQAIKAAEEIVQTAEQRLTNREFESLWDAIAAIERTSDLDSFTLGFRLGVQLTLEGLRPLSPAEETSLPPHPPR